MALAGSKLAGGNPEHGRIALDYYATPPEATYALFQKERFEGNFLEPCVGGGHIAEVIHKVYPNEEITGIDITDRGYFNLDYCYLNQDFLIWEPDKLYDNIVTNPPYSLAQEFVEKSLEVTHKNYGRIAMFMKIQFLEGQKRTKLFQTNPPTYIYVFSKRMAPWSGGSPVDPNTGRKWSTTMCFAWFVWNRSINPQEQETIVRWI